MASWEKRSAASLDENACDPWRKDIVYPTYMRVTQGGNS